MCSQHGHPRYRLRPALAPGDRQPEKAPDDERRERDYIEAGGALLDMDGQGSAKRTNTGKTLRELLSNRMLLGIYVGQYCITVLTYFFLTWFPVYLVKERGLSILQAGFAAVLPALLRLHRRHPRRP